MTQKLLKRLQTQFGFEGLPEALFHGAAPGLRFDLGGDWSAETDQITRVLQALDRARAVCEAALDGSQSVLAVIRMWGVRRPSDRNRTFRRLGQMGFHAPLTPSGSFRHPDDDPESRNHFFLSGPTTVADRAVLLWDACGSEMGIEPSSRTVTLANERADQFASLLVDLERGILINVYDDRGVDVIATRGETLQPLYDQFDAWLLDHGRERMDAMFKS